MVKSHSPFFSVIIPTRNRPALFELALNSVLSQHFEDKEVIVVNDGSDDEYVTQYEAIIEKHANVTFYSLVQRANGHGQSYSMNFGAQAAKGEYLCFLDDDDYWTDDAYLTRANNNLLGKRIDLYYSNQKAFFSDGTQNESNVWIEDLIEKKEFILKENNSAYPVDTQTLLDSQGFAHLNCSIFKRDFYQYIGGMDENIRYECDRDIYIRSIDKADYILYDPAFVSYHNIPDKNDDKNMSTAVTVFEKRLYQLRVYEKGILHSVRSEIIQHCRYGKSVQFKFIAEAFAEQGKYHRAFSYAWQALADGFSIKWLLYCHYLAGRKLFSHKSHSAAIEEGR
ncbi:glycosyltransferase [Photobacterium japonica]|uniref:glycosyltransferase family 2 protein n=1 Tax=Photobacterium japonica TaxID=2910235 RepID=UPI003D0BCE64